MKNQYIRLSKVVTRLGVSRKVVYYWARHGRLPGAVQLNGIWLVEVRIHDLRHTFASWVRQLGMTQDDRMAIMGHTSQSVHEGYAKNSVQSLIVTMQKHSPSTLLAQCRE